MVLPEGPSFAVFQHPWLTVRAVRDWQAQLLTMRVSSTGVFGPWVDSETYVTDYVRHRLRFEGGGAEVFPVTTGMVVRHGRSRRPMIVPVPLGATPIPIEIGEDQLVAACEDGRGRDFMLTASRDGAHASFRALAPDGTWTELASGSWRSMICLERGGALLQRSGAQIWDHRDARGLRTSIEIVGVPADAVPSELQAADVFFLHSPNLEGNVWRVPLPAQARPTG